MWYTHRVWMKELNTESVYRSMGGVTMSPSLPTSWSSWELGGVWNHCCLDVGKRGKGLFGTWKNRNRIRETSNRACAWDHKAGPDHWKLLLLQWPVAAEETRTLMSVGFLELLVPSIASLLQHFSVGCLREYLGSGFEQLLEMVPEVGS